MDFETAFERLIGHEGAHQNHRADRGNWTSGTVGVGELKGTKWGISAMSYPRYDIESLSLEDARAIYRRDFWDAARIEQLPERLRFDVFDAAVNHGPGNARRLLQRALGVADDGLIGPITLSAARTLDARITLARFAGYRLYFFASLATFDSFGRGWTRRAADNLLAGVTH